MTTSTLPYAAAAAPATTPATGSQATSLLGVAIVLVTPKLVHASTRVNRAAIRALLS